MFQGTIPQPIRQMLYEWASGWQTHKIAVACSGNFTIERLFATSDRQLSGCDISIYTCSLGSYFARLPFRLQLHPEHHHDFDWLIPGMSTQTGAVATLMLLTKITEGLDKAGKVKASPYYQRLVDGHRRQWNTLLEKTVARLESNPLQLASFHIGDAVDWLADVPPDTAVASFPPFFAGGYETMWHKLDVLFDWDKPSYQEIFEERRKLFLDRLMDRPHWAFGVSYKLPEFEKYLRGSAQTTNRGVPIYTYTSQGATRAVAPIQKIKPAAMPRLTPDDHIADSIQLVELPAPVFGALRSQYLNPMIKPASGSLAYGVVTDGKLMGVFGFQKSYKVPGATPDTLYLLSDFAVAPTRYARLSKLVLYAALSAEARLLAERLARQRVRFITTTAFSDNPVSMKYRGLFDLTSRKETPDAEHAYALNYTAAAGQWSLAEGLAEWKKKHSKTLSTPEP